MIKQYQEKLGVREIPDIFGELLAKTQAEFCENGAFFLEEAYLARVQEKCNAFPRTFPRLLQEAATLRAKPRVAEYALFLCRAMEHRALFMKHLQCFDFPENEKFLAFLCLVPSIEKTFDDLTARGVPYDVRAATVEQYEECLFVYKERFHCLGMNKRYFDHLQGYVDNKFLNVGRLRYEIMENEEVFALQHKNTHERVLFLQDAPMNEAGLLANTPPVLRGNGFRAFFAERENDYYGTPIGKNGRCCAQSRSFPKSEYELLLAPHDGCLSVHIPAQGALTKENCAESYTRALEIFEKHYPEIEVKALHCHSWMMAPELAELLKPEANLLAFQQPYLKYPVPTKGEDVLNFVFYLQFTTYEDLPEHTSLQRALKKRYLAGEYLYEYGGIIPLYGGSIWKES